MAVVVWLPGDRRRVDVSLDVVTSAAKSRTLWYHMRRALDNSLREFARGAAARGVTFGLSGRSGDARLVVVVSVARVGQERGLHASDLTAGAGGRYRLRRRCSRRQRH